ncbi:MAG: glutamate 5-kinase [Bacteroidota bacterium]
MEKPILVLKFGTASITLEDGSLDATAMRNIVDQVAVLNQQYRIVMVSSGAVGTGKRYLKSYSGNLTERKAAAAIGNPLLVNLYTTMFQKHDIFIAQSLCERQHFSNRSQFLQLRSTYETLWENNIIPIANENDVVSNLELRFSDNDELASLIAIGFGAEVLLLGTSVPGVLDEKGEVVPEIKSFDASVMGLARKDKSSSGLGGMISKLTFARLATRMGIKVVIFDAKDELGIVMALKGMRGTQCLPKESNISARNKWLASGSLVMGRLLLDAGAKEALLNRKSLLAVGVKKVEGNFAKGEVCELALEGEAPFAVARARFSSDQISLQDRTKNMEIAHADEIVLL